MADTITSPPKPNPASQKVSITCGDCVFHSRLRLAGAATPCAGMGCPTSRATCLSYVPNVFSDAMGEAADSKALREALNAVPDAAVASMAMALTDVARLRAAGFKLGQMVYFNVSGQVGASRDFVSNYYRARAMYLNKDGALMLSGKGVTAIVAPDTALSESEWKAKRAKLIAKGAIFDPKSPWTWERKDEALLTNPKYRPDWLDKEIERYRASYAEAKTTRQTHDYDAPPVKRGRGRPRKDGSPAGTVKKVRAVVMNPAA